jgi:hypothetical protein
MYLHTMFDIKKTAGEAVELMSAEIKSPATRPLL